MSTVTLADCLRGLPEDVQGRILELLRDPAFVEKWQREHTTTLDTAFGKITLIASPFMKDGQIAIVPTEPPQGLWDS